MSLQNLKVPSVDTFFLHWPDRSTPIEETLSAVQELYTSILHYKKNFTGIFCNVFYRKEIQRVWRM